MLQGVIIPGGFRVLYDFTHGGVLGRNAMGKEFAAGSKLLDAEKTVIHIFGSKDIFQQHFFAEYKAKQVVGCFSGKGSVGQIQNGFFKSFLGFQRVHDGFRGNEILTVAIGFKQKLFELRGCCQVRLGDCYRHKRIVIRAEGMIAFFVGQKKVIGIEQHEHVGNIMGYIADGGKLGIAAAQRQQVFLSIGASLLAEGGEIIVLIHHLREQLHLFYGFINGFDALQKLCLGLSDDVVFHGLPCRLEDKDAGYKHEGKGE